MRNLLTACLPALALLALGGCAGTSALTSSEDDGVYYSSKDHTTAVASTAPAPATNANEAANPDYHGSNNNPAATQGSGSTQYYDNTYSYMRGVPSRGSSSYYGPGLSYYTPYSPYTTLSYGAGYSWGGGGGGYSPYAYGGYDPFYSSFYSPYGYGSGVSISFGFGRPYGYGGYGYSPYSYGGFYDPYYYNSPFYGGYYGRGGYYGSSYYGAGYGGYGGGYGYGNSGGYSGSENSSNHTYGHRTDRASDGHYSSGSTTTGTPTTGPVSGGRDRTSGLRAPVGTPPTESGILAPGQARTRNESISTNPTQVTQATEAPLYNRPRRMESTGQPQYRDMNPAGTGPPDASPGQGQVTREGGRGRNTADAAPQNGEVTQPQAAPQPQGRQRGGFFQNVFSQPSGGQAAEQPQQRQRAYNQPQRTYEQPQQRAYEQPQQRTYEQPQRSYSQPSYSAPSNGGGGGGGGGHSRGPR